MCLSVTFEHEISNTGKRTNNTRGRNFQGYFC